MPNLDTEEWRVSSYLDYVPKKTHEYVECTNCGGSGTIGGGFKWIGDNYIAHLDVFYKEKDEDD